MAYTFVFHAEAIITCKKISLSIPIFLSLGSLISLYEHTHMNTGAVVAGARRRHHRAGKP
jgi:hypothetical protein